MSVTPDIQQKHVNSIGLNSNALDRWLSEAGREGPWCGLLMAKEQIRGREIQLSDYSSVGRSASPSGATGGSVTETGGAES
jgi:hypothetical protein